MQKKLIALAVAGLASSAAFAQTNVTIYGIADGTVDVVSIRDSTNSANDVDAFGRVSANSSYLGFKGTEDLGNGLKAIFQYESGVNFDNTGGTWASRDSFVGLTGGWGTVVMGNLTGPTRALGAALDVNAGATGIGANTALIGKFNGFAGNTGNTAFCAKSATCTSVFDTRWANSVAYVSPNWGGFSFVGALVPNENKTRDGLDNTVDQRDTWGYDVGVKWEGAGFMAGLTYNAVDVGNSVNTSIDNLRLGGSYTGNWGSVRLMWEQTTLEQDAVGLLLPSVDDNQQKWGIGGTFNLGAKTALIGQYYQALESDEVSDTGAWLATVGVQYSMSKRTMLKAVYSYLNNEDFSAADFGINAAGVTGVGSTVQGFQFGVRHAF